MLVGPVTRPRRPPARGALLVAAAIAVVAMACAPIRLVADYDATSLEETLRLGKRVDLFYGKLLAVDAAARTYDKFAEQYLDIEVDLGSHARRQMARPRNTESQKIAGDIRDFWVEYAADHRKNNSYPDGKATFDRRRFTRLFDAAASAEAILKLESGDRKPPDDPNDGTTFAPERRTP